LIICRVMEKNDKRVPTRHGYIPCQNYLSLVILSFFSLKNIDVVVSNNIILCTKFERKWKIKCKSPSLHRNLSCQSLITKGVRVRCQIQRCFKTFANPSLKKGDLLNKISLQHTLPLAYFVYCCDLGGTREDLGHQ
jgi:hypothetical protein